MKLLSMEEVHALLRERPQWKQDGAKLCREWTFPTFPEAVAFVQKVAALAEQADHHPDIDIRYTRVRLCLTSHDAGGLTKRDVSMLRRLDDTFKADPKKRISMR